MNQIWILINWTAIKNCTSVFHLKLKDVSNSSTFVHLKYCFFFRGKHDNGHIYCLVTFCTVIKVVHTVKILISWSPRGLFSNKYSRNG